MGEWIKEGRLGVGRREVGGLGWVGGRKGGGRGEGCNARSLAVDSSGLGDCE